jgi:hypothetical protein
MGYLEPLATAVRKARYGRRDWLHWRDRTGQMRVAPATADSIKAALLACGTQKSFTLVAANTAVFHRMTWAVAINHLAHAKRGYLW